jgi:hypothetical protein
MEGHHHAPSKREEVIVGVTRDPVLRPVGAVMVVVGALWALFWGMAAQAGSFGQPIAAAALIGAGVLIAGAGKPEIEV